MIIPSISFLAYGLALSKLALALPTYEDGAKPETNEHLQRDLQTLLAWKQHVKDDPNDKIATWKDGADPCLFEGVACTVTPDGYVGLTGLDFNGFALAGNPLPLQGLLDSLPDLTFFHANSNNFSGSFPTNYGSPDFAEIDLSNNKFEGPFPTELLSIPKLSFLDLRFNAFTGEIPDEVYSLHLEVLFLNENQFTGGISSAIANSPASYISYGTNQLTGEIPNEFSQLKNLLEITILENELTGSIPSGWKGSQLTTLYAWNNQLTGDVPEELCRLDHIDEIDLRGNDVTVQPGGECEKLQKRAEAGKKERVLYLGPKVKPGDTLHDDKESDGGEE